MDVIESDLIPLSVVLSVTASAGLPLAASSFRTYVSAGKAPAARDRRGRTPLWDREEVRSWAQERVQDRPGFAAPPARGRHSSPSADRLELSPTHLVVLRDDLPLHEAMVQAEADLADRIDDFLVYQERQQSVLEHSRQELCDEQDSAGTVLQALQSLGLGRLARAQQAHQAIAEEAAAIATALDAARRDLERVREWNIKLLDWADAQRQQRDRVREEERISQECTARHIDIASQPGYYATAVDFVREDPRRLAWVAASGRDTVSTEEVLEDIATGGDMMREKDLMLVLGGADYGYHWRMDGTDEVYWSGTSGAWRVSWIGSTCELYAENTTTHEVWIIGRTPRTTMHAITKWLADFEPRMKERNSLGILAQAIAEQEDAQWVSLVDHY